jgi:hypothetical protein
MPSSGGDLGGPDVPGRDFPGRAEALRRAGEADAALRLARQGLARHPTSIEGHVAAALALLDLHHPDEARRALEAALDAAGCAPIAATAPRFESGFDALGESELDSAFEEASAERDSMIDADGIAFEAMRAARLDEPESVRAQTARQGTPFGDASGAGAEAEFPLQSPFQTRTMADLLERQGDAAAADSIRKVLERQPLAVVDERRAVAIQTLERWLARLRGGDA